MNLRTDNDNARALYFSMFVEVRTEWNAAKTSQLLDTGYWKLLGVCTDATLPAYSLGRLSEGAAS